MRTGLERTPAVANYPRRAERRVSRVVFMLIYAACATCTAVSTPAAAQAGSAVQAASPVQGSGQTATARDAQAATATPSAAASSLLSQPVTLRGTLGNDPVQFNLQPKTEFEGGVEGNYFRFGSSARILLAGEFEGDDVFLEESENGTDVSGQWTGKLHATGLSGEWQSADGTVTKPFALHTIRADERMQAARPAAQKKP
jgi:hypothetical protein